MKKPEMLEVPDDEDLRQQVRDYVEKADCDHVDCDCRHYIYEAALKAYYGKNVFTWMNKQYQ